MNNPSERGNLIGGEWRLSSTLSQNVNPSDISDVIGEYASGTLVDLEAAIDAAAIAFPKWSRWNPVARSEMLAKIGNEIIARKDELGEQLAREEGKTRAEGVAEAMRAGQIFCFFAAETVRNGGEILDSLRDGVSVEITREPLGIVGLITPWNFPLAIPAWKMAPALAFGNCVVMKPADLVTASAWSLAEIVSRSGIPDGVFNLVMGPGLILGSALAASPKISGVSFTGSVPVGRQVITAAAPNFTRCQLEMGGKNPLVVLADADLDLAVNCALQGGFGSTGQRCTASSKLIVDKAIHDRFVAALIAQLKEFKVGHSLDPDTRMGPVVDGRQRDTVERYIEIGRAEGATLAWGGGRPVGIAREGFYLQPALFTDTTAAMTLNREEIFGPVATVIAADGYEEALELANGTEFGLCAGIMTNSHKHISHFKRNAEVGVVTVNAPTAGLDFHVAFGGRKGSSYGPREQGRYAREFFTTVKTTYLAAN